MNATVLRTRRPQRTSTATILTAVRALAFEHIDYAVDCTEGPCAAAASAAVYDEWSFAFPDRLIGSRLRSLFIAADDLTATFDQAKDVCWVGRRAKVWPARVLELGDFSEWLEGGTSVGQGDFADGDMGMIWI